MPCQPNHSENLYFNMGVYINATKEQVDKLIKGKFEVVDVSPRAADIKDLPRMSDGKICPTFVANGNRYTILDAEDGLGIHRYNEMQKRLILAQFGFTTFLEAYNYIESESKKIMTIQGEGATKIGVANLVNHLKRSISEVDNARFNQVLYLCSLFVVGEGEDTTRFSIAEADKKIEDWASENYNAWDFFAIALGRSKEFATVFSAQAKRMEAETEKQLLAATGLNMVRMAGKK